MNKIIIILATLLLSMVFANAQTSEKEMQFGGRIMYDMAAWGAEEFEYTGSEFRRVRLYSSGKMYVNIKYKLQLDFSGGKISFKDVWMELSKLPLNGNIRVGHFKEPLRLEGLTSSKYITFMERALPIAMSAERNTGAMYHTTFGEKISLQTGVFREGDSFGNDKESTNNINITSRITYLVMNDGDELLHLGASNSIRKNSSHSYGFSSRAENHLGNKLMSVDFEDVEETNILGGEIAYVNNSLSVQAEYLQTTVMGETETELSSYYGQISYFLSGESRPYKSSLDGFSRVRPNNNYGNGGKGAIELVARTSSMDLTAANEGVLNDITLGVNWYLNPHTRVMLNYVMGEMTKETEVITENSVMMRVQLDF
jgi:phosphate-selective porin OprO and OprP